LTFSISAGLAASTVTPGSTAPDASRTVPAIEPFAADDCARAAAGKRSSANANTIPAILFACIAFLPNKKIVVSDPPLAAPQNVHATGAGPWPGDSVQSSDLNLITEV
jgi:hypothetical protein